MKLNFVSFFILSLFISGCALKPPKYQEFGVHKYNEWNLKENNPYKTQYYPQYDFLIQVTMEGKYSHVDVRKFIDLYAAELTIREGYEYYLGEVKSADFREISWSGGGISSIEYYPYILLFIKLQEPSEGAKENYTYAPSIVEKMKQVYKVNVQ